MIHLQALSEDIRSRGQVPYLTTFLSATASSVMLPDGVQINVVFTPICVKTWRLQGMLVMVQLTANAELNLLLSRSF